MLWILFLLLPLGLFAQGKNLSSDLPMEFDGKDNSVVARQNATFVDGSLMVIADEIRYSKNSEVATATGNVRMNFRGSRLVADKLSYSVKDRTFEANNFRLGFFPYMVEGKRIHGTPDKFVIEHSTIYGSQTGKMAPNVYTMKMTLRPTDSHTKLNMQAALVKIGPAPILPVPVMIARIPRDESLYLRMAVGSGKTWGTFVQTETLYPVMKNVKAGLNADYYSKRGWLAGPKVRVNTATINSELNSGYIADRGNRGVDSRNLEIPKERGWVDWKHKQQLGDVQLTQQVQYWSDSEILRDYRRRLYNQSQAPDSFTEAFWPLPDTNVSVFARYDPNNFDRVVRTMPEVRIDRLNTPIANTGVYYSFYNSFARLEESEKSYNRYDGIFSVSRPTALTSWWQINPVAAVRETVYDSPEGATVANNSVSRTLGEFGFDSQWSFYQTWEVKNEAWDIDGLKHTVQPVVQYRYLPQAGVKSSEIPDIQGRVFDTNLRPTDFFYRADIDNLAALHLVRLGVKQSLQTRNTTAGQFPTRELLTLELYQDYNLTDTPGHPHWDSFYILAEANPNAWIGFGFFGRANLEDGIWQEHRVYTTLKDADYRTLTFSTRFLKQDIEQYNVIFTQRLTNRLTIFADATYDAQLKRMSDLFAGVRQRLRSGWEAEYGFERRVNDRRDDSTQLTLRFKWLNF